MVFFKRVCIALILFTATFMGLTFAVPVENQGYVISIDRLENDTDRFYPILFKGSDIVMFLDVHSVEVIHNDDVKRALRCKVATLLTTKLISVIEYTYEYDMTNIPFMTVKPTKFYLYSWEGDYVASRMAQKEPISAPRESAAFAVANLSYLFGFDEVYDERWLIEVVDMARSLP